MEKVGKSADFAGDLLGELAGLIDGGAGNLVAGLNRLTGLSKGKIDGEDGLREAVVEFTAEAAPLFVLELEEVRGKAVDSAFGVLQFADIGEGRDDAQQIAVGIELGDGIAKDPENVLGIARKTEAQDGVTNRHSGSKNNLDGALGKRDGFAVHIDGLHTNFRNGFADGIGLGEADHIDRGVIYEFDASVGLVENHGDVEVTDESAKTLFAFAKGVEGAALFGEIGERDNHAREFAGGGKFGDGVEQGPDGVGTAGNPPADETIALRQLGGDGGWDRTEMIGDGSTVFVDGNEIEILDGLADSAIEGDAENVEDSGVGINDAGVGVVPKNADMKVLDERAEAFFTGAKDFLSFLAIGDVADHDKGAARAFEIEERGRQVAEANFARFFAKAKFNVANKAGLGKLQKHFFTERRIEPEIELAW